MRSPQLQGFLALLVMAAAWGVNWPVMKALMLEWPPFIFRAIAGSASFCLLMAVALWQRDAVLPKPGQWWRVVVAGLLNVFPWSAPAPLALFWLPASEAAIIAYTMPIWANILAWPLLGERPNPRRVLGLLLGLAGVAVLLGGQLLTAPPAALVAKLPGIVAILGTAVLFACGAIFTKRYPIQMPPLPLVAWQLVFGLVPVLLGSLLFERLDFSRVTGMGWGLLGYTVVLAQCVAYFAWFAALKRLPASTAAIGTLMVPIIGVISSGLWLGEALDLRHALALALTLSGVMLASRS